MDRPENQLPDIRRRAFENACQQALTDWPPGIAARAPERPVTCMGLSFSNRLGIAAGFDRTGRLGRNAGALGFGSIEIGSWQRSVPPQIAGGGPPRMTLAGIRLAIQETEAPERETDRLKELIEACWWSADYLTLAPNWLRTATAFPKLHAHLVALIEFRGQLAQLTGKHCPIVFKLRLTPGSTNDLGLLPYLASMGLDGILICFDFGKPFTEKSFRQWDCQKLQASVCHTLELCRKRMPAGTALLTNGGVQSSRQYRDRLNAGADLVQVHNALVFKGPDAGYRILQPHLRVTNRRMPATPEKFSSWRSTPGGGPAQQGETSHNPGPAGTPATTESGPV